MSMQGILENKKHGGAQEKKRENLVDNSLDNSSRFITIGGFLTNDGSDDACVKIQNGGQTESDNDQALGMEENIPFLPELRTEYFDNYEQAIVENNAEWLKSRCKNLDQVEFDIAPSNAADDALAFTGITLESKSLLHSTTLSQTTNTTANSILSNNESKFISSGNFSNPSSSVSVLSMENEQMATIETDLNSLTNSAISFDNIIFNDPKKSKESDTNAMFVADYPNTVPTQIVPNVTLCSADGVQQNVKLCVKDGILTMIPDDANNVTSPTEFTNGGAIQINPGMLNVNAGAVLETTPTIGITENIQQKAEIIPLNQTDFTTVQLRPGTQGENLALATISISTDKSQNSTKILVDTSQGQQLYQLNMSDLTQLLPNNGVNGVPNQNFKVENNSTNMPNLSGLLVYPDSSVILNGNGTYSTTTTNAVPMSGTGPVKTTILTNGDSSKTKTTPMFMCSHTNCSKLFKTVAKLTVHNMTHTGERPFKCTAEGCDWAFTKAYKLKRHEESHQGRKEHVCHFCNKKFTTIYNLNSHVKQHDRPCTEECPVVECGQKFQTHRELDRHLKTHDGIEKTYKCPFEGCNKLFLSPHCLGSHPRVHMTEPQDLTCQFEGCGRKFDKLCRLRQHQRSHTGERPYPCHYAGCNWAFSTASKLTRHMTKHTNKRKWLCKVCGKAFLRSEHLKGHIVTHTGIKPFNCPVEGCGQKFVAKSSVYVHMKKHDAHDKEITYHCPMEACDKKYATKAKLRQHIVKHFPGTLTPADAAQLDIVPLVQGTGWKKNVDEPAVQVQPSAVCVKTSADGTMTIDPIEFISKDVKKEGEVTSQFTAELTAELASMVNTADFNKKESTTTPAAILPKIAPKKVSDANDSLGSARTDYHSNKLLSDRAKKRRKLLREKAEGSSVSEDNVESNSSITNQTASSSSHSSHGITFRDPETGVLYVQTQLLQDDPPHPELYSTEDNMLHGELSLPGSSDSDSDSPDTHDTQFVGSTINLQDLVD